MVAENDPDDTDKSDVIFYTSDHCAPCTMMKRKLEAINKEMPTKIRIKTIDIENAQKSKIHGFRMAPVLKIVKNDEIIVGDVELEDLRNVLIRNLYFSRA